MLKATGARHKSHPQPSSKRCQSPGAWFRPVLAFVSLVSFCGQSWSFGCSLRVRVLLATKRHKIHKRNNGICRESTTFIIAPQHSSTKRLMELVASDSSCPAQILDVSSTEERNGHSESVVSGPGMPRHLSAARCVSCVSVNLPLHDGVARHQPQIPIRPWHTGSTCQALVRLSGSRHTFPQRMGHSPGSRPCID